MANTKIPVELSGTPSIVDNGNATAITIDSSENVTFAGSINFGDNDKAVFGAGSDLQIYHDGSDSYVDDAGVGDLVLRGNNQVLIRDKATNDVMVNCRSGEFVKLYYNNAEKLATTSTGIDVTGITLSDGYRTAADNTNYSLFTRNSTNTSVYIQQAGSGNILDVQSGSAGAGQGTSRLLVKSDGNVGIGTTSPSELLHMNNTSGTGCFIRFQNTGGSGVYIGGRSEVMEMYTNGSEKMRIDSSGNVGIGTNSPTDKLHVVGTSFLNGNTYVGSGGAGNIYLSAGTGIYMDGGTGSANHLDDYEEGTWTASAGNGEITMNSGGGGEYTKIGNIVYFTLEVSIRKNSSSSNQLQISGLPFSGTGGILQFTRFEPTGIAYQWINGSISGTSIYFTRPGTTAPGTPGGFINNAGPVLQVDDISTTTNSNLQNVRGYGWYKV